MDAAKVGIGVAAGVGLISAGIGSVALDSKYRSDKATYARRVDAMQPQEAAAALKSGTMHAPTNPFGATAVIGAGVAGLGAASLLGVGLVNVTTAASNVLAGGAARYGSLRGPQLIMAAGYGAMVGGAIGSAVVNMVHASDRK